MSMSDPIADMLTRIRNAQAVRKQKVGMQYSKIKEGIARVLKDEGYILDFYSTAEGSHKKLVIALKYVAGRGVIDSLERLSRPGLRRYRGKGELPRVRGGLGIVIVSTSKGIMSDARARAEGCGGEMLCAVA